MEVYIGEIDWSEGEEGYCDICERKTIVLNLLDPYLLFDCNWPIRHNYCQYCYESRSGECIEK